VRFEDIRGPRYTEIFQIGGSVFDLGGVIYNPVGLNGTNAAAIPGSRSLDHIKVDDLKHLTRA
jgi:hypothetical protein